jgi:ribokinase
MTVLAASAPLRSVEQRRAALHQAARALRVLVVGSLNVDTLLHCSEFPEPDSAVIVDHLYRCPGGHAGNCSTGLAALGVSVRLIAAVGVDPEADMLLDDLRANGIDTNRIQCLDRVATGQVFIPTAAGKHYMLLARGANDHLQIDLADEIRAFQPQALVLFDPPHAVLMQAEDARAALHDPPRIYWCPGPVNAADTGLSSALSKVVDVIVVNEGERQALDAVVGLDSEERSRLEIATTRGARGVELSLGDKRHTADAISVDVVDTVGSGDAFLAAYVLASEAGMAPGERLLLANGYGALAATRVGARAGLGSIDALVDIVGGQESSR